MNMFSVSFLRIASCFPKSVFQNNNIINVLSYDQSQLKLFNENKEYFIMGL